MANCSESISFDCLSQSLKIIFICSCGVLIISVFFNIFFCALKFCSGKKACVRTPQSSQSTRQMADNPIYGNISCTSQVLYTEVDASHSSYRDRHRVNRNEQDCYANLSQNPHLQSGIGYSQSPSTQYSDIVDVVEMEEEKVEESITDDVSTMSDLYASVQTQRTKNILTDGEENYANHL